MSKLTNFQNAEIKDASNLQGQYWGWGWRRRRFGFRYNNPFTYSVSRDIGENSGTITWTRTSNDSNYQSRSCTYSYTRTENGYTSSWNCMNF